MILALVMMAVVGKMLLFPTTGKKLNSPTSQDTSDLEIIPSETLKEYSDPSGFSFNYPDNLDLLNNEATDSATYADVNLSVKNKEGTLHLKIADSKYKTIKDWAASDKGATLEATNSSKLGDLTAMELKSADKLILGAIDQGILFTVEIPNKDDFWQKVYKKVIADFSFAPQETDAGQSGSSSSDDVSFEGEEVIE